MPSRKYFSEKVMPDIVSTQSFTKKFILKFPMHKLCYRYLGKRGLRCFIKLNTAYYINPESFFIIIIKLALQHAHIKLRIMTYACTIKLCILEGMLASSASFKKEKNRYLKYIHFQALTHQRPYRK